MEHSVNSNDFIQPVKYDAFGREPIQYLPYTDHGNSSGIYYQNFEPDQHVFYKNPPTGVVATNSPTSQNVYDNSPLNQIREKGFAGDSWQVGPEHHTIRTESTGNQTSDSVRHWVWVVSGFPFSSDYYPLCSLYKTIKLDENSDTSAEYTDKEGHMILNLHGYQPPGRINNSFDDALHPYFTT
jgi:hypothetical protein